MYTLHKTYGDSFNRLEAIQQLGIPYGAVLPTIGVDYAGPSIFFLTTEEICYVSNGAIWIPIQPGTNIGQSYVISGTAIWSGTALIVDISDCVYKIIGTTYTSSAGSVTHAPADATFPRLDTIYLDTAGLFGILTGIPAAVAIKPQVDPATQVELRTILVPALATTPGGIANVNFYNEHSGESTATSDVVGVDYDYTVNPISGLKSTLIPDFTDGQYLSYQKASAVLLPDAQHIKFNLLILDAFSPTTFLSLYLKNGTEVLTNVLNITHLQYGFNRTLANVWQEIVIPITDINFTNPISFDTIYFRLTGASLTGFQLDYLFVQTGPPVGTYGVTSFNSRTGNVLPLAGDYKISVANYAAISALVGDTAKVYVAIDTGQMYEWDGSSYNPIGGGGNSFLGVYASLVALQTAHPTAAVGQYAQVDAGVGTDVLLYLWDDDDAAWVQSGSSGVVPVVASSAELNTGTDNVKFASAAALESSKYVNQNNTKNYAVATGTDTYAATMTPAITAYAAGQRFDIKFTNANTGASTININGLGAKNIYKDAGTALSASDISAGRTITIVYDGTNFQTIGAAAAGAATPDADAVTKGKIQLAGDLAGTAAAPTITNAAVIAKVLTAYSAGVGTSTVLSTDTILQAIQKLDGNAAQAIIIASSAQVGNNLFNYYNFK